MRLKIYNKNIDCIQYKDNSFTDATPEQLAQVLANHCSGGFMFQYVGHMVQIICFNPKFEFHVKRETWDEVVKKYS